MSIPAKDKPRNPKLDEFIASLHHRNIEAVSKQYNLVATKIASHMRDKQIEAGLLRPPKRVADELSNDTPGKPLKKVCQRTSTDQPSRLMIQDSAGSSHLRQSTDPTTHYDLTYNTDQELAGTGTETVAYDDSSGGRNDGPGPQNAAVGIRDDQLSIPSPQSTSCNRLHESLEQNIIPSNPKTTAAAMSTTSTPSPASNPDAETQPGRENTLSDRLQTESQKPDAVSGALSLGPNSLPADGSPRSDHTASSHPNSGIPQEQHPFLLRPNHTDISGISEPMPNKFKSMPSQQQSPRTQQNSQFQGDDLQTSQQSTAIGHMDMGETVASVSTPVTEPRYFESSQNINEKSAGQKSAPIVAQDEEEEQQPGSSHSELQNRDWDIQAGADHAGNPDTCLQADTMRMHNLLNESQDSRSATESCQSGYCSGPATNDDAQAQLKRFSSQQLAERSMPGRTTTSRGATGLPTPPHMGPGQEGVSSDIRDAYDQQTASTPNTRFSHTGPTLSQHRPPNSQPASGPSADSSSWRSYTTVTRSTSPWRQASLCTPAQNLSVMRSASVDTTGCNSSESSGGMPRPEDSTSSAILLPTYDNALAPAKDSPFDGTNFRAEIYSENPKSYWDMVKEFHVETSWDRWLQGDARHSL
ncbi:hypothetical protein BFJ63_vAg16390 [Fusarium oxysporum f. sp. narcissi]|nr:hypothetical protein BFJ63_vAg16390 [Fusarium oxysporum f. sp. narcissi]